jgi:prepilin-type N-terminal cleavage/methylation domain-containing protein
MRRTIHPDSRGGFTLVELIVVVTIIAVLVALISSGVMAALARGDEVRARNEVSQLANAIQSFKTQFQVQYIPDRIVLPPGFDAGTKQWMTSVWPRMNPTVLTGTTGASLFDYWQVYNDQGQPATQPVILQGDQVLVWVLGGWKENAKTKGPYNVFGFSTDPTDPMKPYTAGSQRHGPFFEGLIPDRLALFSGGNRAPGFPSFVDVYSKVPYIYFSSGKAGNDYTTTAHMVPSLDPNSGQPFLKAVLPFKISANKYANPSSFQIICAGRDQLFGDGDVAWAGASGPSPAGLLSPGVRDDIANFSQTKLGD